MVYSVLSATTGSLFAALLAGASPEIRVKITLRQTRNIALPIGNAAMLEKLISGLRITFTIADIRFKLLSFR